MYRLVCVLVLSLINFTSLFGETIHDYLDLANESLVHQNYYNAVEYFKEALEINSSDISANKGLSDSFFMLGEYEEALLYIDKCIMLGHGDLELVNSKGRILTALGSYEEAENQYNAVLDSQMYNVGARSGLAELRIAKGDLSGSLYDFEKILKFSPNSRRILLSLVVLNDSQGNSEKSDDFIQKAIIYYPQDPVVLEAAVRHYMYIKSYRGASLYMDELLSLSDKSDIKLLQVELLIHLENFDEALSRLNEYLKEVKDNPEAYYLATVILDKTGEKERALSLIKRGMDLKPDDEIYRFYSEEIMNDYLLLKDSKRDEYSNWYFDQGKLLEERYYYEKANDYYLRGLELNPFNMELRLAYAGILKKMGYRQRYLKELELISSQESENSGVNETLLIENSLPLGKLYEIWGNERWNSDNLFSVTVFVDTRSSESHLNSASVIKGISRRFFSGQSRYFADSLDVYPGTFSTAFNSARISGSDYFLLINYLEGSRTFSLKASLHLTKSGREIGKFSYMKTGNNRIFNCFRNLSVDLNSFFPIVGTVTDIKNDMILIDLGKNQGITEEITLDVVKKGRFTLIPDKPLLYFESEHHLGTVQVKSVGESMSDGLFTAASSFNLLNIGDNVLFIDNEDRQHFAEEGVPVIDTEVINQLLMVN